MEKLHTRIYRLLGNEEPLSETGRIQAERNLIKHFQGGYFRRLFNYLGKIGGIDEPTGPTFTERGIARKLKRLGIARNNEEATRFADEMIYTSWPTTWLPESNKRGFYFEKNIIPVIGLLCQLRQHDYD